MIKLFKAKIKPANRLFNYEGACEKEFLTFNDYVLKWLAQFDMKILATLEGKNDNGTIDFIIIDNYSSDSSRTYCITTLGGRLFEINEEFVEEFSKSAKAFGGKPVIFTNNNLSDNAATLAGVLGVEVINRSMLRGINDFILNSDKRNIKENSEMFINRLTYYIKQTLQGVEV